MTLSQMFGKGNRKPFVPKRKRSAGLCLLFDLFTTFVSPLVTPVWITYYGILLPRDIRSDVLPHLRNAPILFKGEFRCTYSSTFLFSGLQKACDGSFRRTVRTNA